MHWGFIVKEDNVTKGKGNTANSGNTRNPIKRTERRKACAAFITHFFKKLLNIEINQHMKTEKKLWAPS